MVVVVYVTIVVYVADVIVVADAIYFVIFVANVASNVVTTLSLLLFYFVRLAFPLAARWLIPSMDL